MQRKTDHNAAGFGAIGILLVVVAAVIVGFVGWRVYDASKVKQTSPSSERSNSQTQAPSSTDTATYLDIKELGVKIKLDDPVKDATYTILTLSDGSLVARFSTQSLATIDPACDAKSGQLGALERSTADTDRLGNKLAPDGQTIFKFGDYYFTYATSQALCSEKIRSTVTTAVTALRESLKTLQPDQ